MPDTPGSLMRHAAAAACLVLAAAAHTAAQIPQPVVAPAPSGADFLPRYEFHLTADKLTSIEDPAQRFDWDTHFGGSMDLADLVYGRAAIAIDYEAVLGTEFRPFDPNQGNYTLEGSLSARGGEFTEFVAVFHHVSRHLSDRPKRFAVAYNAIGGRILQRVDISGTTIDVDADLQRTVQHSFVDYTWIGELQLQIRRAVAPNVAVFAHGVGQMYNTDGTVPNHDNQFGGLAEAGVRFEGARGALELFAGVERRVDAYPTDRVPQQWGLAGFRLISR